MVKVFLVFYIENIAYVPPWFQSMIEITRTSVSILTLVQSSMTINFASWQVDFRFTCPKGQMKILEKKQIVIVVRVCDLGKSNIGLLVRTRKLK